MIHFLLQHKKKLSHKSIQWITYPTDKDKTDSELAITYAIEQKFDQVLIFGTTGDRLDHFLANITIFARLAEKIQVTIITDQQVLYFVTSELLITGKKGDVVSLIPVKGTVRGIVTSGLQYQLKNETLYFGKSRGVSNVLIGKKAKISIKSGVLLVIYSVISWD